jgi:hypothetical protein
MRVAAGHSAKAGQTAAGRTFLLQYISISFGTCMYTLRSTGALFSQAQPVQAGDPCFNATHRSLGACVTCRLWLMQDAETSHAWRDSCFDMSMSVCQHLLVQHADHTQPASTKVPVAQPLHLYTDMPV